MIELIIPGIPKAQPRAKARRQGMHARVYTPKTADAFKAAIAITAKTKYFEPPIDGPVKVEVEFVLPRPQSMVWKTRQMPRVPCAKKPDGYNLVKAVYDALKGIAWRDDSQVVFGSFQKWTASGYEQPHTIIRFERV